jgi:phosphotransferase system  glucose/maltose/N-acetylglucosamine-specific IIC component
MVGDLRDKGAYALAIAALGLALAILLVGVSWVAAQHDDSTETFTHVCPLGESVHCRPPVYTHTVPHPQDVPEELWYALALLGGVFVGTLVPISAPASSTSRSALPKNGFFREHFDVLFVSVALLALAAAVAIKSDDPLPALTLAGLLLGFLIPSPARGD